MGSGETIASRKRDHEGARGSRRASASRFALIAVPARRAGGRWARALSAALCLGATACARVAPPGARVAPPSAPEAARGTAAEEQAARLVREAESARSRERAIAVQLFMLDEANVDAHGARRQALEAESAAWRAKAITAYTALVDAPGLGAFPGRPSALLSLAELLKGAGDAGSAEARLRQLLRDHPTSAAAPEAYLSLAELTFASKRLAETVSACDGVLRSSASASLRKRALYMKAWSLRGLGGSGATVSAMEALREIVRLGPSPGGSLESKIDDAAADELVELYAAHGDLKSADAFFADAGGRAGARLLEEMRARAQRTRRLERLDRATE